MSDWHTRRPRRTPTSRLAARVSHRPAWQTAAIARAAILAAATAIAALPLLSAAPALAQQAAVREAPAAAEFTLQRIHGSRDFAGESVSADWMADGRSWTGLERAEEGGQELWRVDAASGERERLIAAAELMPEGASEPLDIDSYQFSADERRLLLFTNAQQVWRARTKGEYWVFDLDTRALTPVSEREGWQLFAKFSPDARHVAFVREHDLFVTDLETGEERALTRDGSETIINGTTDWVYEEELNLRDAFRWSPDGRRIAYWQLDQSPIASFYLIDETELYPRIIPIRYPKAGTPNSKVRVGSLELATGETTWFDIGSDPDIYVARMEWTASADEVLIQQLNRHQNRLDVLVGDAASGATRPLLTETDDAWVDVRDDLHWLEGGERFLWISDRDGWLHLYLYNRDGRLERQLTRGEWDIGSLEGVDEERGVVYLTAAYESPLTRSVLAVPLAGGDPVVLTEGRGSHGLSLAPGARLGIHSHSTATSPSTYVLRRVSPRGLDAVRTLEDNAALAARLDSLGLGEFEFLTVPAADGTPLNAYIIKPPDFDPTRRYGLLLYVYGGPGSQTVVDRWGGTRALWFHYLAQRGVLVASVDNRGTGSRGRDFKKQTYLKLGQLETADQLAAVAYFGDLPYVDEGRIGIWGWSYGGYMTLLATLLSEGAIAAGASVAPVTHWQLYDTIYTERYMRTPRENPEGYATGSPLSYADKLQSELLIVHGTGDDNVHSQNTLLMAGALEEANKQFRMRLYPNKRHGISGGQTRVNVHRLLTDFLLAHLGAGDAGTAAADE